MQVQEGCGERTGRYALQAEHRWMAVAFKTGRWGTWRARCEGLSAFWPPAQGRDAGVGAAFDRWQRHVCTQIRSTRRGQTNLQVELLTTTGITTTATSAHGDQPRLPGVIYEDNSSGPDKFIRPAPSSLHLSETYGPGLRPLLASPSAHPAVPSQLRHSTLHVPPPQAYSRKCDFTGCTTG